MKKITAMILASAMFAVLLAGCGAKADQSSPQAVVETVFTAIQKADHNLVEQCVEQQENGEEPLSAMLSDEVFGEHFKNCAGQMTFEIGEPAEEGDTATVPVSCKYRDASEILNMAIQDYMLKLSETGADDSMTEEDYNKLMKDILDEKMKGAEEKFSEKELEVSCTKQGGKWVVTLSGDLMNVVSANLFDALGDAFGTVSSSEAE